MTSEQPLLKAGDAAEKPAANAGYTLPSDLSAALSASATFKVQEQKSLLEALTGYDVANKYDILDANGNKVFVAEEQTDCCRRFLKQAWPDCVSWELNLYPTTNGVKDEAPAFIMKRPGTCTCCCFNRPVATVEDRSGHVLGTLTDPFACCSLNVGVSDNLGNGKFMIDGGFCQPGIICPIPCGPCAVADFKVADTGGNAVGNVQKKIPDCWTWCCYPKVTYFDVDANGINDPVDKALLLAGTIFVDFRFFNTKPKKDDGASDAALILSG